MGSFGALILVAQSVLGFDSHDHRHRPGCREQCGREAVAVRKRIEILRTSPKWRRRDDAAHELRKYDWRCHSEAAIALAEAMIRDCHEEVREESAESLAKLAPRLPEVHLALRQAADIDPDHATRKWANRGLQALGRRCEGSCSACAPVVTLPAPEFIEEPGLAPIDPPHVPEPRRLDLPAPLPDESPFVAPPTEGDDRPALEGPLSRRGGPVVTLRRTVRGR